MRCSWRSRSMLHRRCLIRRTEYWIRCRWELRHSWCDLRFLLPLWTTDLWRVRVQILRRSSGLWGSVECWSTSARPLEIMICMPVLLLMPGLTCWINTQSDRSHLRRKIADVLVASIHGLRWLYCLRWKVAFLLHLCTILQGRARVLIRRLTDRRTATLLVARWTGCNRWPKLIWLIFPPSSHRIRRSCA
jgi:hypothetical protein